MGEIHNDGETNLLSCDGLSLPPLFLPDLCLCLFLGGGRVSDQHGNLPLHQVFLAEVESSSFLKTLSLFSTLTCSKSYLSPTTSQDFHNYLSLPPLRFHIL